MGIHIDFLIVIIQDSENMPFLLEFKALFFLYNNKMQKLQMFQSKLLKF